MKTQMPTARLENHPPVDPAPHILCVDQDGGLLIALFRVLSSAGLFCEIVADGKEAFERLTSSQDAFDLLITDHNMSDWTGLKLVEQLRASGFKQKVIVHSRLLREQDVSAYRALNVDAILTKPWETGALLKTVLSLVKE